MEDKWNRELNWKEATAERRTFVIQGLALISMASKNYLSLGCKFLTKLHLLYYEREKRNRFSVRRMKGRWAVSKYWRFHSPRAFLKHMVCSVDFQLFCVQLHEIPLPIQIILINNPKHFFRGRESERTLTVVYGSG